MNEVVSPSRRNEALDALRGIALVAMFGFHLVWDLAFYRLVSPGLPFAKPFVAYGHTVASTFLLLVGASLVLASRNGIDWRAFGRRLAMILAACIAITAATWYLFPDSFIFFGILHCIALSSVVALPFLRAPWWLVAPLSALALSAPMVFATQSLDGPMWWWLGLGTVEPRSNDWRPFLPWFGVVLTGTLMARLALARELPGWLTSWRAGTGASRALVWGGRHSLLVYLVHQPVFIAIVFLLARAVGPDPEAMPQGMNDPFVTSCTAQCTAANGQPDVCLSVCTCISTEIRRQPPIWQRLVSEALTPADREKIDGYTKQCVRETLN